MIKIYSVLPQGLGTKIHFFKSDTEEITSDNNEITSDTD